MKQQKLFFPLFLYSEFHVALTTIFSRMKRLKAIKLQLEAHKDEQKILYKLEKDFKEVFGLNIFEEAVENCGGDLMSLYSYYKNYARD
mgnify:CR=1 FL=1